MVQAIADCREKTSIIDDLSRRRRAQPRPVAQFSFQRDERGRQRIVRFAELGTLGSGANRVEALLARLIAATLSRSARAFFAPWRSLCARISRWASSALRFLRSIRFSILSTSPINFAASVGDGSAAVATSGGLTLAVARLSRLSVGLAAGVVPGTAAIVIAAAGVLPDRGTGELASRLTTLRLDVPPPSVSALDAASAACRASFEAC